MRKPTFVLLTAMLAAVLGGACADDPKRPPAASDSPAQPGMGGFPSGSAASGDGGKSDASSSDGGDAGACTSLPNTGVVVDQSAVSDDLPAGTGGVVLDGTYDVTEARVYQGTSALPGLTGNTYQGSIRITGSAYERVLVFRSGGGAVVETRVTGTFTQSGTNGTITLTCPTPTEERVTYSVLNNSLTVSNVGTKESFVFAKQP